MTEDLHTLQGASPSTGPGALPLLSADVSRRKTLFGVVALALAPVAALPALAASSVPDTADACLLADCDKLHGFDAAIDALCDAHAPIDCEKMPGWFELEGRRSVALYEIVTRRATTLAGAAAKAKVLFTDEVQADYDWSDRLSTSIAEDVLQIHGGRSNV